MIRQRAVISVISLILCMGVTAQDALSADWPMWRYDAGRTASSPGNLPREMHLLWVRQYSERETVWDDPLNQDIMPYDRIFEPVVSGATMFMGFNDSDKIVAIDTGTGEERWRFYADGPVRLAPAVWNGRVYFTSDDGCLYCVDASTGSLVWKFRGGPNERRVLGNKRLISMWPARGGPVIHEGIVYFAASIWPFMGIFIYALDADTGEVVWINDKNGSEYMLQPHNTPSFAGVAPQGSFVISGDMLLIPGGRSVPACFDRHTGKFLYYRMASSGKTGGSFVAARGDVFFNHHREKVTTMYHLGSGNILLPNIGKYPVLSDDAWYFSGDAVTAYRSGWVRDSMLDWISESGGSIETGKMIKRAVQTSGDKKLWDLAADASGDLIQAGDRLYAGGDGTITAIESNGKFPAGGNGAEPEVAWVKSVEGRVERLIAADDKLFAVTLDGRIMAFGADETEPRRILDRPVAAEQSAENTRKARSILEETGVTDGYALFYGAGNGDILEALVSNSKLHVIAVDPDENRVLDLKRRFDANGLYGSRVSVHRGDPGTFHVPQYMISLTIVMDPSLIDGKLDQTFLERMYQPMRPYGGVAWLPITGEVRGRFVQLVDQNTLPGAAVEERNRSVLLKREGPLPGSGVWTHNYGNSANTAKSDDERVKLPLGLLWFGGNSNMDVLPRHGHGPPEQVVGGRLYIEGMDCLSARDVYTGRVLWKVMLHDLGTYSVYYDQTYRNTPTNTSYNQVHIPGANNRGTNYIATLDRVYVIQGQSCTVLDSVTGEILDGFSLPPVDPEARRPVRPEWGYIGVYDDLLIGGYGFVAFTDLLQAKKEEYSAYGDFDKNASKGLVALNRYTGEVMWKVDARHGFLHNGIAIANDRIFCLDKLPPHIETQLLRRGKIPPETYRLLSLDVRTGDTVWEKSDAMFGSFLSYSDEHDILLQSTRPSRDMIRGETGERIITYRGDDGAVIWDKAVEYPTFPVLHGDMIITEGSMYRLLTGEQMKYEHPLTGKDIHRTWKRNYGCNYPIASEHIMTFRSGAAGFFDLANMSGTGNFGGFKSGCTINLVAADGVLNAPDYTRTCQCSYQNQTSLAMAYMPDADIETWTFNPITWDGEPVKRVGINFGAPGDHIADNGTLWLDYPSVGGDSPDIPVRVSPEEPAWYRFHSSRITGDTHRWAAASGGNGISDITVTLSEAETEPRPYTVILYFTEPETIDEGERVFDVYIQGTRCLTHFDIVRETGNSKTLVMKKFENISIDQNLKLEFKTANTSQKMPVISGIEIVMQGL